MLAPRSETSLFVATILTPCCPDACTVPSNDISRSPLAAVTSTSSVVDDIATPACAASSIALDAASTTLLLAVKVTSLATAVIPTPVWPVMPIFCSTDETCTERLATTETSLASELMATPADPVMSTKELIVCNFSALAATIATSSVAAVSAMPAPPDMCTLPTAD